MMTAMLGRRLAMASAATVLATGLAAVSGIPAWAGAAADKTAEAEAHIEAGRTAEAIAAFDEAHDALWNTMPLSFRVVVLADSVSAFGKYEPANGPIHAGDTLTIYLEPVGYGFAAAGDLQRVSFTPSIEIRTPGGLILGKTGNAGRLMWEGRSKSREVHATLGITLPDLKPGAYELLVTIRDDANAKKASATLPFTIE